MLKIYLKDQTNAKSVFSICSNVCNLQVVSFVHWGIIMTFLLQENTCKNQVQNVWHIGTNITNYTLISANLSIRSVFLKTFSLSDQLGCSLDVSTPIRNKQKKKKKKNMLKRNKLNCVHDKEDLTALIVWSYGPLNWKWVLSWLSVQLRSLAKEGRSLRIHIIQISFALCIMLFQQNYEESIKT